MLYNVGNDVEGCGCAVYVLSHQLQNGVMMLLCVDCQGV